mgnify:CR=1 FL=1
MKYLYLLLLIGLFSCKDVAKKESNNSLVTVDIAQTEKGNTIDLEIYDFNGFKKFLNRKDDKVYVINFWATWCAPCVKELPYFEKIIEDYKDKNVEVILVSLDFPKQVEKKLIPFINKKNLQSEVILLDDTNENVWINAIDESWSGAIPATLIYNKENRKFYEQSFDYEGLERELKSFINL